MKPIFWKYRFVIPLIVLAFLLIIFWFHNGLIHGGGDEELLFVNARRALDISSTTWLRKGTGSAVLYWLSRLSLVSLINFFNTFFFIPNIILQAAFFFILLATGILSVYFLTKKLISTSNVKNYIGFSAALFYILNPFSMSQVWGRGQYAQFFSFALLPLSLLIFIYGIKKRNYSYALLFVLISVLLSTSYGFVTFIVTQWFAFFIYAIYEGFSSRKKSTILFIIKFYLLCLLLWIIAHCWWLLPFVKEGRSVFGADLNNPGENIGTLLGVSQSYPLPIIIRLLQSFYFFSPNAYSTIYSSIPFQMISYIPVIFLIVGIFSAIKSKIIGNNMRFFLLLFIIGLCVSLGANPPLGPVFVFIFTHIPILQAFRNPYEKFGLVYMLGYSILFGIGTVVVARWVMQRLKIHRLYLLGIGGILFLIWNIFLWPMWTGKILAGSEGKIGLSIPSYYAQLEDWLKKNNTDYRVMMTPLWNGDSAAYLWGTVRFVGVDPLPFFLNEELISNSGNIPYYYDYVQNLRRYMGQINIHPALELLRVKYLINREDATLIRQNEKNQYKLLTREIYPLGLGKSTSLCQNLASSSAQLKTISSCTFLKNEMDWRKIRYITLSIKTKMPSFIDLMVQDNKGNQIGWDGRSFSAYKTENINWNDIVFPLGAPTAENSNIDISHIHQLQVFVHPLSHKDVNSQDVYLKEVTLSEGGQRELNEFDLYTKIGKLDIFKPRSYDAPPEFGILSSNKTVNDFLDLFQTVEKERNNISNTGYIITAQDHDKNINSLLINTQAKITDKLRVSDTKYWIKINGDRNAYIVLAKTFYPGWKLIKNVDKKILNGNLLSNLELLNKPYIPENQHFVVDGYANMWRANGQNSEYAIVFIPQLYAEIGYQISKTAIIILAVLLIAAFRNKIINYIKTK